jgi:hypothetical protein
MPWIRITGLICCAITLGDTMVAESASSAFLHVRA